MNRVDARALDQGVAIVHREIAERHALGQVVTRIDGQHQHEERIYLGLGVVGVERIHVAVRLAIRLAAPYVLFTVADRYVIGTHIHLRHCLLHAYAQGIDAVATHRRDVLVFVQSGIVDRLSVPGHRFARHDGSRVMTMERDASCQDRGDDAVATQYGCQRVDHQARLGIGPAVPIDALAERQRLGPTRYGIYGQGQVVNAVLARLGYKAVEVVGRRADALTIQVAQTVPRELLVLAYGEGLLKVVTRLVARHDQSMGVVTARLRILGGVFIYARLRQRVGMQLSVQHVLPVVRMRCIDYRRLLVQLTRMLHDGDLVHRVGIHVAVVGARRRIGLPVEFYTLTVAYSERHRLLGLACTLGDNQLVRTVTVVYRLIYTVVSTGMVDQQVAPHERGARLYDTALRLEEHGIDVHHIHVDTVHARIGHTDGVIHNCVRADTRLMSIRHDRVSGTNTVILGFDNAVGSMGAYHCAE